jgi:hypothetical protein
LVAVGFIRAEDGSFLVPHAAGIESPLAVHALGRRCDSFAPPGYVTAM